MLQTTEAENLYRQKDYLFHRLFILNGFGVGKIRLTDWLCQRLNDALNESGQPAYDPLADAPHLLQQQIDSIVVRLMQHTNSRTRIFHLLNDALHNPVDRATMVRMRADGFKSVQKAQLGTDPEAFAADPTIRIALMNTLIDNLQDIGLSPTVIYCERLPDNLSIPPHHRSLEFIFHFA